jgi:hypothetical protein
MSSCYRRFTMDQRKTSVLKDVPLTTEGSAVSPGLIDIWTANTTLARNTAQDIRELENEIAKQEYINKYLESYNKL